MHACVRVCVHACKRVCVLACVHACMRACVPACVRVYACAVYALLLAVKYLTSGNAWHIFEKLPFGVYLRPVIKFE